jgi:hypothetical protein
MNEEKKRQIVKALTLRVGNFVCPICHQSQYTFVDGYTVDPVQEDYKAVQLGGRLIPSVMLVCNHCGHIDRFSLGVLGLMEKEENKQAGSS